jgi:16S rRNA (cytosine967-C5)-methyltransferase
VLVRLDETDVRFETAMREDRGLAELDGRDAALAWELAAGTTRRRRSLDAVLAAFSDHPLDRMAAPTLAALRLGAYQLLFLERVPKHAAVDESVGLARTRGRRTAGFVNAVLRRVAAEGASMLTRLGGGESVVSLGVRLSYPDWLVARWVEEWGAERGTAMLEAGNRPPERCVRVNTLKSTIDEARASLQSEGLTASRAGAGSGWTWTPEALLLEGGGVERSAAFREGFLTPQSRASQLVGVVAADRAPAHGRIADLCAAPGAKTAHLAARLPAAHITAVEVDPGRAADLRRLLTRLGVTTADVTEQDATALGVDHDGLYQLVLLDAPCSGLGTVAARPDLRWRRRPGDAERLAKAQAALLRRAARLLSPGGAVVYAVCTLERRETVDVVASVVAAAGLLPDDLGATYTGLADPRLPTALATMPDRDQTSGFFVARLRRAP